MLEQVDRSGIQGRTENQRFGWDKINGDTDKNPCKELPFLDNPKKFWRSHADPSIQLPDSSFFAINRPYITYGGLNPQSAHTKTEGHLTTDGAFGFRGQKSA